jgi:HPr kinase/phosphorylase
VKLALEEKTSAIKRMFEETIPCCIFTHALTPTSFFFEEAERKHCPILQTSLSTADFVSRLIRILTNVFSPRQGFDGVLMEVYGLGVLIQGLPGVGKSESALELIKRGHRLVADDIVKIHCINGNTLLGTGVNKIIGHFMEIRGLGIIDIFQLFGIGAVLDQVQVQLVIQLEKWDPNKKYDRLGLNEKFQQYFGVSIPELEIPVGPERNIPSIVETAAMNERLKKAGHDTVRDLRQNIMKWQEKGSASPFYEDIG